MLSKLHSSYFDRVHVLGNCKHGWHVPARDQLADDEDGLCRRCVTLGTVSIRKKEFIAELHQSNFTTRQLPTMSLEERLTQIRDNPKLQGQQQVCSEILAVQGRC
jgi:hypothetical protein